MSTVNSSRLPNAPHCSILTCLALFAAQAATATPVQWKKADGGNDHWYEVVSEKLSWYQANAKAKTAFNGRGYLATITSQAENDFVHGLFATSGKTRWLGGFQNHDAPDYSEPAGGWQWVTGEPFSYKNWNPGEPNNGAGGAPQDFLHMYAYGTWDDCWASWNECFIIGGYVVEAPPQVLTPPQALSVAPTAIRLTWSNNGNGVKGFRIQSKEGACDSPNDWGIRADVGAKARTFLDTLLASDAPYSYRIATYFGAGSFSEYSACASATTSAAGTPHIPVNLQVFSRSNTRIDLNWRNLSENETSFEVFRKVGTDSWALLDTVVAGKQTYTDLTATGNNATTAYAYDVRACNDAGCSLPNLPTLVPFRPINLAATVNSAVKLTWKDQSSNESAFHIERRNGVCTSDTPWVLLRVLPPNTQAYTDTGAASGTTYAYRVRAAYHTVALPMAYGRSSYSGCVTATAP